MNVPFNHLPICNCGIEEKVAREHKLYHIRDTSKYYGREFCGIQALKQDGLRNREWADHEVNICDEKKIHRKESFSPEEVQAYLPLIPDIISPSEIILESDPRVEDSIFRTAQRSTLTKMLPLKPMPVKKKEAAWGSYQDTAERELTYEAQAPKLYRSMMTRYFKAMIDSKVSLKDR